MPNFTENSRKEFEKFTENLQPLFRGAMLIQTKKSNSTFEISEQRIFIIVINVLSQNSRLDVSK